MYFLTYHDEVQKDIARLGTTERRRISGAIKQKLLTKPELFGKPLRTNLRGLRSLRVTEYRVIFELRGEEVFIIKIDHRKNSYHKLEKRLK